MTEQIKMAEIKKHQRYSLVSTLRISLPECVASTKEIREQPDVSQYIRNKIVKPDDTNVFYRMKSTRVIVSKAVIKAIFHEYFDNTLSYDEIGKLLKIPVSRVRQLIDLAY